VSDRARRRRCCRRCSTNARRAAEPRRNTQASLRSTRIERAGGRSRPNQAHRAAAQQGLSRTARRRPAGLTAAQRTAAVEDQNVARHGSWRAPPVCSRSVRTGGAAVRGTFASWPRCARAQTSDPTSAGTAAGSATRCMVVELLTTERCRPARQPGASKQRSGRSAGCGASSVRSPRCRPAWGAASTC
jgi:hypothetical protein